MHRPSFVPKEQEMEKGDWLAIRCSSGLKGPLVLCRAQLYRQALVEFGQMMRQVRHHTVH